MDRSSDRLRPSTSTVPATTSRLKRRFSLMKKPEARPRLGSTSMARSSRRHSSPRGTSTPSFAGNPGKVLLTVA